MSETLNLICPSCRVTNRVPATRLADSPNCGKCKSALFTGKPIELSDVSFTLQVGKSDLPILVDFWAEWCGPCKMMAPEFARAAGTLEPQVRLCKLDTENNPDTATQYGIRSIPTLILFKQGKEVARQAGAMQAAQIEQWVRQHL